jgi:uncharacterized protein (DUF1330 family)
MRAFASSAATARNERRAPFGLLRRSFAGGRIPARGQSSKAFELGVMERVVLLEFDSVEQAAAAYNSPARQGAQRSSKAPSSATSAL